MQNAALIAWLATAGGGLTMVSIWMAKGGVRQAKDETAGAAHGAPVTGPTTRLDPWKVWSHVTVALVGLAIFILYMVQDDEASTGYEPAPWIAFALLLVVAGFGLSMAIPWFQDRRARTAGGSARRKPAEQSIPAIVVLLHGLAASTTIVLVGLVALGLD
jgi:FtsH-binding integral membrane protein